jgi:hypothetical protein
VKAAAAQAGTGVAASPERDDDDSFAVEGAKIGSTLRIRLPDRALVTDGAALQVQDDNEQYTTLAVSSQKHIGVNFTTAELTMQLDDFAERVLKPPTRSGSSATRSARPARRRQLRWFSSKPSRS